MLIFVSGGVRSGKSALGERLVLEVGGRSVYLATAEAYDDEMAERIAVHRQMRAGKGFVTIEQSRGIGSVSGKLDAGDAVLLDCLGTLAANEMFGAPYVESAAEPTQALADRIFSDILSLRDACKTLVVISNDIFSDGIPYDGLTKEYMDLLATLHRRIAEVSDAAVECVYGTAIVHKGVLHA